MTSSNEFTRDEGRCPDVPSHHAAKKWLRAAGVLTAAAAASLASPAVWAANASQLLVTLEVKPADVPVSGPITYAVSVSRAGLDSYVSYRLTLKNSSANTVNQVVVTASTAVTPLPEAVAEIAPYAAFVNLGTHPNCPEPGTTPVSSVTCTIGQLKSGEGRDFFLLFKAPLSGANVVFNGNTDFSEGSSSGAPPALFTSNVTNTMGLDTTQTADINKRVRTVLPPAGGSFFTGPNGLVNASNLFSTTVSVPATSFITDNQIKQDSLPSYPGSMVAGYFLYGLSSTIDIRNALTGDKAEFPADVVTITLRQDAASITVKKPTPSVHDVKIFYSPTTGVGGLVPNCSSVAPVVVPTIDNPCVSERKSELKGKKGYYQYTIKARDNGVMSW